MKKFILSLGLIAMAFGLTNCTKNEEVNPVVETKGDFAIYASVTRTANDGINTVWSAKDEINVFHAVGETTNYVNDTPYTDSVGYPFVCEDATTGRFLGSLNGSLDVEEEYDWYAFYPYSSYIKTPANNSNGFSYVGSKAGSAQVQNGNNSMAHIAGSYYPMAGYAVAVSGDSAPHLTFDHLSSLIEFEITNKLAEAITVSEIQFIAEEDIVGSYYINFADANNIKFTSSGDQYISNTAILTVEDGEAIAAGKSAKFYAAVKPFVAKNGSNLTIKVSASSASGFGVHEKDITLSNDVTFSAGKIKNVKVDYTTQLGASGDEDEDISELIDFSKQGYANGIAVSAFDGNYCSIAFNKGSNNNAPAYYTTGDAVRVYGGSYFTITSEQIITGVAMTFATGDGTNAISTDTGSFTNNNWTGEANSIKFTVAGSSGHRRIQKLQITYKVTDPAIIVNPIAAAATGAEGETTYNVLKMTDDVTATFASEWISAEAGEGKITYEVEPNYTGAVRVGEIVLSSASAGITKSVVVEQAADVFNVNVAQIELGAAQGATAKFTVNSTYPFTITNPDSAKLSFSATSGTGTVEIIVTALTANTVTEVLNIGYIKISRSGDSTSVSVTATQAASGTVEKEPVEATLSFANKAQRTSYSTSQQVWEQNGIVFTNAKGSGNNIADYANPVRLYANSSIAIEAPGPIQKVVFTCSSSSYASAMNESAKTVSGATVSISGTIVTMTFATPVDVVTITKLTAQIRLSSITVTYK